jgi:hypothetical protein
MLVLIKFYYHVPTLRAFDLIKISITLRDSLLNFLLFYNLSSFLSIMKLLSHLLIFIIVDVYHTIFINFIEGPHILLSIYHWLANCTSLS